MRDLLARGCLLLDGPTGTQLVARGLAADPPLWTALAAVERPDLLRAVHQDYLDAGAQVLTANTFRTSSYAARQAGLPAGRARDLTLASVAVAREAVAASGRQALGALVAGSLAPLADCYHPEQTPAQATVEAVHGETASWLAEAGCDLALVETMGCGREAVAAVAAARRAGLEVLASLLVAPEGTRLLGGDDLLEVARGCLQAGAGGVGVNCVHPSVMERALAALQPLREAGVPLVAYANADRMRLVGEEPVWEPDGRPLEEAAAWHAAQAAHWVRDLGVRAVGTCCGTTPLHIRLLWELVQQTDPVIGSGCTWIRTRDLSLIRAAL